MRDADVRLDELVRQTESAVELLDEIEEALAAVQTDERELSVVRRLFATELSKTWSELDSTLSRKEEWETIDMVIIDVQDFLEDLHEITLSPRRTELESRFDDWLKKWSVARKADPAPFLEDADEENLTFIENLIEEMETVDLECDLLQHHFTEWLSHQVKSLGQIEKKAGNLEAWLRRIRDVASEACGLDETVQDIAESIRNLDHEILQLIGRNWLDSRLAKLNEVGTEQDNPHYASWKAKAVSNWEDVERKLPILKPSLLSLNTGERSLVRKHVDESSIADASAIERLTDQLAWLIGAQETLGQTPQLQTDDFSLEEPAMESVKDLWHECPGLPDPLESDRLESYIGHLRVAEETLDEWLVSYESVNNQLLEMGATWRELAVAHDVRDAVKALEAVDSESENLGELARTHNSLLKVVQQIQRRLRQDLPEDEKEVLGIVYGRISRGEERLDAVELASDVGRDNCIELLERLAHKNLVRIEVTTTGVGRDQTNGT